MAFVGRLCAFQLPAKSIHKFLTIALIAPLIQIAQIAAPNVATAAPTSPFTSGYTSSQQSFVVPAGVTTITISIRGGRGGAGGSDSFGGGNPGNANLISGSVTVTPGETILYGVGGGGGNGKGCLSNAPGGSEGLGNFGGSIGNYSGGAGANSGRIGCSGSGGGGGAATVIVGSFGRIVAAGSGGGSGGDNCVAGNPGRNFIAVGGGGTTGGAGSTESGRDGGGGGGGGGGAVGGTGGSTYNPCPSEFIGFGGASGSNLTQAGTSASTTTVAAAAAGSLSFSWTTPPNAPINVIAIPGSTRATVSWTSGGTSGATISGYRVTASPGGATCDVASALITSCTFAAGSLTNGTAYTFTVRANSSAGYSPASSASSPEVTPNSFTITYDSNTSTSGTPPSDSTSYPVGDTVTVRANSNLVKTNHTLTGWNTRANGVGGTAYAASGSATFRIETNTVLYAQWAPIRYTLTYNGNGSTSGTPPSDGSSPYLYNSSVTVLGNTGPGALARTNFHFTGWNTRANGVGGTPRAAGNTFTIDTNTVLFAQWAQYTLTYNSNSATSGLPPTSVTSGGQINLGGAGSLARTGFFFDGWQTAPNGGSSFTSTGLYNLETTTTLYAKWSQYRMTYDTGTATSGSVPGPQSGVGTVTLASNSGSLAKPNFYWAGWSATSNETGTILTGAYSLLNSVTLYPRWAQYTLSYDRGTADPGGSTPSSTDGFGNTTTATNSGNLAKAGLAFSGWNTQSNGSGRFFAANSTLNLETNTVLYPFFSTFTIRYETGTATSGSVPAPQVSAGTVTLASNSGSLAKPNFYWAGWTTNSNETGTILTGPYTLSANVILYPRWAQYTITYEMTGFDPPGGSAPSTLGFGNTVLASSAPGFTKSGATLGGWTTGPGGTGTTYNLGATYPNLTSSITLYAKWRTQPGSSISISNPTVNFPLADTNRNFVGPIEVPIRITESAGTRSNESLTATATGSANCSIIGSALNIGSTLSGALTNTETGLILRATGIANCSVTVTRSADTNFSASRSNTVDFQFYPINQIVPLLVDTSTVSANVGTAIPLNLLGTNIGSGDGAVSYAAYGNNCFINVSDALYTLNATLPTTCQVIVTRAADKQWAIATSQRVATFRFEAVSQTPGFTVTPRTVNFGTTVTLTTTGGSGNGAVSYAAFGTGCTIASVNRLSSTNAGNCTVVAYKSASGPFKGQTSAPARFTFTPINQAPITVTSNNAVTANAVFPNTINLSITGGTGSGAVNFAATPTSNCQVTRIDSFTATLNAISVGNCTVTAWKSASNGYNGVLSRAVTYAFGIAPPNNLVLVAAGGVTSTTVDESINLSVSGQVTPGGAITFARFNNNNCYFDNIDTATGTATLRSRAAGRCNVQVTQASSGAYLAASSGLVEFTFTGGAQAALNLTFSSPDTSTITLSNSTMNMVASGGTGSGTFAYTVTSLNGATCGPVVPANASDTVTSLATITSSSPGICQVTVVKRGDAFRRAAVKTTNFTFTGSPQNKIYLTAESATAPALSEVRITLNGGSGSGAITFFTTGAGCQLKNQSPDSSTIVLTAPSRTSCRVTATKAGSGLFTAATTFGADAVIVNFGVAVQAAFVTTVDNLASGYATTKTAEFSYLISTTGGSGSGVVTFEVYGNGNCKLDRTTPGIAVLTSIFQTATCSVVAKKANDSVYGPVNAAAVSLSFTAASQADLTITSESTSAAVNAPITFTVAGGNGDGALRFSANNSSGGNCLITPGVSDTTTAERTVTSTTLGNCSVTVVKSGSGVYGTKVATSSTFNFGSAQNPLTLIPETTTPVVAGEARILLLQGGFGAGSVTWYGGGCAISNYDSSTGRVTVRSDNEALTCNVSAIKAGSGGFFSASSNAQAVTFTSAIQDPLVIIAESTTVRVGDTIVVRLTGGSGAGTYRFVIYQTGSDCTVTDLGGGTAQVYRAGAGNCSIQGIRSGDKKFSSALSSTIGLNWGLRAQEIPLVISNDPTYASAGETITLTTVGGEGEGVVTFQVIGDYNPSCVLSGDQNQFLYKAAFGTCMIRATKAATAVFAQQRSQNIVFTFFGSTAQDPLAIDVSAPTASVEATISLSTTGGTLPVTPSFKIINGGTGTGTISGTTLTATSPGTIIVVATKQGDSQYASVVSPPATFTFTG